MRIGCECSVFLNSRSGSAVYVDNLLSGLALADPDNEIVRYQYGSRVTERTLRTRLESVFRDTVWSHAMLPFRAKRDGLDVLFCSTISAPFKAPCPVTFVILDLIPVIHPEWFDHPWMLFQAKRLLPHVARSATRIVTISEQSRTDISTTFGIDRERIAVIPPAVDKEVFRPGSSAEASNLLEREYGIRSPFLLFVGAIEPRKNVDTLIRAYSVCRQQHGIDLPLVIVGDWGWKYEPVERSLAESRFAEDVKIVGFVPTSHLPHFYDAAECLIYPSSYEGFGLPVAEAMACGCPVITSPVSSIPEVAGNAAVYVPPRDVEALSDAIRELAGDETLRQSLGRMGLERATAFSWERSARRLQEMFEEII